MFAGFQGKWCEEERQMNDRKWLKVERKEAVKCLEGFFVVAPSR
jgi:hypothetical protein